MQDRLDKDEVEQADCPLVEFLAAKDAELNRIECENRVMTSRLNKKAVTA